MKIRENVPLAPLTTFQVGGPARFFVEASHEDEVCAAVAHADDRDLPLFVLGGGSNLLVSDSGWPGLVLKIAIGGIEENPNRDAGIFTVGAGKDWDSFVAHCVARDCAGIEGLSGIPGSVGGTPVQNVGAYGQEVSETIIRVRVLDRNSGEIRDLQNAECRFAYRTSILNTCAKERYIVLRVTFALKPKGKPRIEYADLKKYFAGGSSAPTLAETREAVRSIRLSKAMLIVPGDDDCRSAGSFFKNPVMTPEEFERLRAAARGGIVPSFPAPEGKVKVAAAWLVESAGFGKGLQRRRVAISRRHALAIVNRGGASAAEIIALKNEIQDAVAQRFGVDLQPEPTFVGFGEFEPNRTHIGRGAASAKLSDG